MKPHIFKHCGLWICSTVVPQKAGLGFTPHQAYREWRDMGAA